MEGRKGKTAGVRSLGDSLRCVQRKEAQIQGNYLILIVQRVGLQDEGILEKKDDRGRKRGTEE